MDVIRLNVSGKRFLIKRETLQRYPGTRLAELGTSSPEYNPSTKDYYFDRNSKLVPFILDLYRTGELHLPQNLCPSAIKVELLFWGIPEDAISDCCWKLYFRHAKDMNIFHVISNALRSLSPDTDVVVDSLRQKIWLTMSVPDYSPFAKVMYEYVYYDVCEMPFDKPVCMGILIVQWGGDLNWGEVFRFVQSCFSRKYIENK